MIVRLLPLFRPPVDFHNIRRNLFDFSDSVVQVDPYHELSLSLCASWMMLARGGLRPSADTKKLLCVVAEYERSLIVRNFQAVDDVEENLRIDPRMIRAEHNVLRPGKVACKLERLS